MSSCDTRLGTTVRHTVLVRIRTYVPRVAEYELVRLPMMNKLLHTLHPYKICSPQLWALSCLNQRLGCGTLEETC